MIANRHISNPSVIIAECMILRDKLLANKNNGFEGDSKIVIDYYNKKSNISNSIMLLMKDIWKLS